MYTVLSLLALYSVCRFLLLAEKYHLQFKFQRTECKILRTILSAHGLSEVLACAAASLVPILHELFYVYIFHGFDSSLNALFSWFRLIRTATTST